MVQLYNFIGSWQLFPEKGQYENGKRPKNGVYRIEQTDDKKEVSISHNWTTIEDMGYSSKFVVSTDHQRPTETNLPWADEIRLVPLDSISFEISFLSLQRTVLQIVHEIMPNGYLKVTSKGLSLEGQPFTNAEVYHRQLSVLPYSASVSGAVVKPNEEGLIRHKALNAMEEQTNMQLEQIRRQIELLALQAQEIHKRKELSMLIYNARLSFKPEIGQVYYLYEKADSTHIISLISPREWGASMPFQKYVATVQLLADHTWKELEG